MRAEGEEGVEADDPHPEVEDPRQFCVCSESGSINYEYIIGSLLFEAETGFETETRRVSLICVSVVENKLLVAIPFSCWHRLVRERKLPPGSLSKAVSLAVGASLEGKRDEVVEGVFVKLWLGFISAEFEACITFQDRIEEDPIPFLTEDHEDGFVPSPEALVTVADEKFSFLSLESGEPGIQPPPQADSSSRRIAALEEAVLGMKQGLQVIMDRLDKPAEVKPATTAKSKVAAKKPATEESGVVPGLDPQVVKSALQSGIDRSQLEQLGQMMGGFGGKTLGDAPAAKKKLDPLGEVVETQDGQEEPEEAEVVPSDPMTHALVKLTNIVDVLASNRQKKPRSLVELLDESIYVGDSSSSSSQLTSSRRHSAVLKALRKALVDSPAEVYSCIESRMLQDFGAPEAGPGQPDSGGTFRGWVEHRSHVAGDRWYGSHFVGRLWSTRCVEKGQGGGGKGQAGFVGSIHRPSGGRQGQLDFSSRRTAGRKSTDSFVHPSPASRDDRVAAHEALGCDLGRSVHAQNQRDRRLCRETPEAGGNVVKNPRHQMQPIKKEKERRKRAEGKELGISLRRRRMQRAERAVCFTLRGCRATWGFSCQ